MKNQKLALEETKFQKVTDMSKKKKTGKFWKTIQIQHHSCKKFYSASDFTVIEDDIKKAEWRKKKPNRTL